MLVAASEFANPYYSDDYGYVN